MVADLRRALSVAAPPDNTGHQLGRGMARAALQWLQEFGLQAELRAENVVTLQVKKRGRKPNALRAGRTLTQL